MPQVISPTELQFSKDISEHRLKVIRDDGVDRHVRCRIPGTEAYGFDIITWGGHILITGDMGSWLFMRLWDMFEFFRSTASYGKRYPINPDYWSEKLLAVDCHGRNGSGATEYDAEIFKQRIEEHMFEYMRNNMIGNAGNSLHKLRMDFKEDVKYEVLARAEDGEQEAIRAACDYVWSERLPFKDFYEVNCHRYRHHLIWCMYAIVWTIHQYDALSFARQRAACCALAYKNMENN